MRILVTGAAGFLGLHLVRRLVALAPVRALYHRHLPTFRSDDPAAQAEWLPCNIANPDAVLEVMRPCTHCYHVAARVSFDPRHRNQLYAVNYRGTAHVVNAALSAGISKLVHVSSVAAIGRGRNDQVLNEEAPWQEDAWTTHYARSKRLAELEVFRGMAEGLTAVIGNPSLILGPGDWSKGPPHFFRRVRQGLWFYPPGGTAMVDVDDVVEVLIGLMHGPYAGERFIISSEDKSFYDLFSAIARLIGARPPRFRMAPFAMELLWRLEGLRSRLVGTKPLLTRESARLSCSWSRFDSSKVQRTLGFRFRSVDECLERTAAVFLKEEQDTIHRSAR
ncbi:MAG: NAD-dependent epimerase/dehydratase family protein [Chitinophagales bacterium]|nr:NAD-dependent epimerase/dehydratase family protein [Chitinophagales bacterium]MDW8393891.1 NAD-dependent epimerase/dehydratase family protein [Chitinophagales bacterium]